MMNDDIKTNQHLVQELAALRRRVAELEELAAVRQRKDEALRVSEERLQKITECIPDLIWTLDLSGRFTYANIAVERTHGWTVDEFMERTLPELVTPRQAAMDAAMMEAELAKAADPRYNRKTVISFESEELRKDGSTFWAEIHATWLWSDEGKPVGIIGVSHDITERKLMEEELKKSRELLELITENMSDMIRLSDLQGNILYISPSHFRGLGYKKEERLGMSVFDVVHPDDLEMVINKFSQGLVDGYQTRIEYRVRHKDGHYIWLDTVGDLIKNEQGAPAAVITCSRDITQRKLADDALRRSEERYRTIFENSATANILMAEDTTIIMANDNFARLSGYNRQELEGKLSWTIFVHPDDRERMKAYHRKRRIDPGSVPSAYDFRVVSRKGEVKNMMMNVALIPESKSSIATLIDMTAGKQLEAQFIQAQKMESVGRLAGGVAHDFNNMLSVILGNTELAISRLKTGDPLYKTLQEILNAGMRSADLTRQLLAFARKQAVVPKVLDLNDTVAGMLKMLRRLIGEDIDLGWRPGPRLWKVNMDPSQVDQLLANLTVNARDAIEKAGRVIIETSNTTCDEAYCADQPDCAAGDYVVLTVSDNGCGMEKEMLANIFEPFFTTKKEGQGTGLGLATVYGIVKQNGGFINTCSEPGQGTTFSIHLPRYRDEATENDRHKSQGKIQGGTETILIAEDEEAVLKLSENMLVMLGYKVLAAKGHHQALRLAEEYHENIDMLLTDVVMPGMSGKELAERLMAIKPGLKCLYMSGYTADIIARQGILDEGIQFISKPFSVRDLAAKVRETLAQ